MSNQIFHYEVKTVNYQNILKCHPLRLDLAQRLSHPTCTKKF